jgi:transcription-repair coupling factor (superfamily II helicase)
MQLSGLTRGLRASAAYRDLLAALHHATTTSPILRAARPFMLATLAHDWHAPIIYVTARGKRAHNVSEQLPVWLADTRPIYRFAEPTPAFYDRLPWDNAVIQSRLEALAALNFTPSPSPITPSPLAPLPKGEGNLTPPLHAVERGQGGEDKKAPIIITSIRALMQRTMPATLFRAKTLILRPGERHDMTALLHTWLMTGYTPASIVTDPGTFSKRGGILDIFPVASAQPVRIEFFGDEIDRMKFFQPETQRTTGEALPQVTIMPAREALPELLPTATQPLTAWFENVKKVGDTLNLLPDADALSQAQAFPYLEFYLPYLYADAATLLDYAPENALIVLDDPEDILHRMTELTDEAAANQANNVKTGQLPPDYPPPFINAAALMANLQTRRVLALNNTGTMLESIEDKAHYIAPDENDTSHANIALTPDPSPKGRGESPTVSRLFSPGVRFGGQLRPVLTHARDMRQKGAIVVIITEQTERLNDLWAQEDASGFIPKSETLDEMPAPGSLLLVHGTLGEGWTLHSDHAPLYVLTDAEIFNWSRPEPRRRKTTPGKRRLLESHYADWNEGDYVVHVDYGIGRFTGMTKRILEGTEREYLIVEYDGGDMVFVPIHNADRLTRYVGTDDTPPKLNRPGRTIEWIKAKEKARKAAAEEARELLAIYARRANSLGYAFPPDTAWQHELEASFPYIETEDQLRAIRDVKQDMENAVPMDRLVCGDVGYGKTEVALRAAFKAVMSGRQVAVLVPTTVLADQHYHTFSRRMDAFPLKVEVISRFRTKAEQTQVLKQLADGQIDIIIGTHRLLSADVKMKQAGLVIIDEEQRFGVKHKEHFKKLRANVDVLTLTATPIPRTLYMSLSGVRDISMIQTPPEERLPIITHVGAFDPKLARQAILRELDRGGQVFIIHNRIKSIEEVREKFADLVPEASIIVGHGQMNGRQLERIITDFTHGKHDILLATSIIENGIDMPNVNTLIVDRADWFGMSQLYQIRGRVGRGAQQAYCYFFHPGKVTEEAHVRLETLAEHADLGAGFQIAVRDLELRGAGDILSTRQTGHIAIVGLQLYTQLLQQAVNELKHDSGLETTTASTPASLREQVIIDLPITAYIPQDWLPEMNLRLQLYRRIGSLETLNDVAQLHDELIDRFGALPPAVDGLLYQIQVKLLANAINATAVMQPRQQILIKLPWLAAVSRPALAAMLGQDVEVSRTAIELTPDTNTWRVRLLEIMQWLQQGFPQNTGE